MPRIAAAAFFGAVALFLAAPALPAALPATWQSDCASDLDPGSCERLTYIAGQVAQLDDDQTLLGWAVGALLVVVCVPILMRTFGRET